MRFTLVSTFYPPHAFGGDAVHVHQLAAGLARRGHRVRVVHNSSAFRALGGTNPMEGFAEVAGVETVDLSIGRAAMVGTYLASRPLGYTSQLEAAMRDADIVHFHNPSLLGGVGGTLRTPALRAYTAHEHWLLCPMHTLFRNEQEVCTRRTCLSCCASYHRPPQPWRWSHLLDRAVEGLDVIMCPSRFTARLHRDRFPHAAIEVIRPPGPRSAERQREGSGRTDNLVDRPPFVLFAGRLQPIKGARWLAEALSAQSDLDTVFVGDGPERDALVRIARSSPRIVVLGQKSHDEVLRLCAAAQAVVVPSVGYETFGSVGREALSVGTPILVRNLGPLPELIEHGGGASFADADELRALVSRIAHDAAWYQSLRDTVPRSAHDDDDRFFGEYFGALAAAARRRGDVALAHALDSTREAAQ